MGKTPQKKRITRKDLVWAELTREQKDLYITLMWEDGFSDQAMADFLQASKGQVVGHRHRYLAELKFRDPSIAVKAEVKLERFRDLLDLDQAKKMQEQGVEVFGPVSHDHDLLTEKPEETTETSEKSAEVVPFPSETIAETEKRRETSEEESAVSQEAEPELSMPSTTDLPFLPPPDSQETPPAQEVKSPQFIAEEVAEEPKCEWPTARGIPCGKKAEPGSKLCAEHQKLVPKGRLQWW